MTIKRKNIVLLAGNGQNVGKTLFACQLIKSLQQKHSVIGIKICPHFHDLDLNAEVIASEDNYQIIKETHQVGSKDSNRLLAAGAKEVYYVQSKDKYLNEVLLCLNSIISTNSLFIIESGGLRNIIRPGLFIMIESKNNKKLKPNTLKFREIANLNIEFDGEKFSLNANSICFSEKKWIIKN
ncbi:hypothetical protein [Marinifilum sp.]|uniref:hypothetical protein n=1 Tax=Marinifilum sp. TaxID=2033137 RepID=UPI003BA8EA4D